MADRLTFDKEQHKYYLGSEEIPGVTTIIKDMGLGPFSGAIDRSAVLEAAADRGTKVHDACQMFDENDLDIDSLDPIIDPYVRAWIKFREESGFTPKLIEEIVFDPVRRFCGRLDRTGIMGSTFSRVCLDIKTGEVYADAGIQLAAYLSCLQAETGTKRIAVKLSNNGTYRVHEFKDRQDIQIFHAACTLWHWRKREGLI